MNRTVLIALVLGLSLLGLADSWYLYQSAVTDTALSCDIGAGLDGCNLVAQSPYSNLFGVPLALYGVGFYVLMFMSTLALMALEKRLLYRSVYLLALAGVVASFIFVMIQFVLIKALCVYCVASAVIAFIIWSLTRRLWKLHAPRPATIPVL